MPPDRALYLAALVCFLVAVPMLPVRINLVALGLALATLALAFWLMAGVSIRVEVDAAPVLAILEALSAPDLGQVAALALNDTVANARVAAAQQIAPRLGLPSKAVKDALTVERARPDHLEAAIVARGKAIPMIQFRPRASATQGVSLRVAGKVETYRRAFIAVLRSGYKGVFERRGRARGPLRELYGPSVPGMFARSDVQPVIQATLRDRLVTNLQRQLERRMRRNEGKHRGKWKPGVVGATARLLALWDFRPPPARLRPASHARAKHGEAHRHAEAHDPAVALVRQGHDALDENAHRARRA